ncbi:hypothetical protein CCMSSC00406_0009563 [Pleurotus cornucopiae]|uniref:Uncharacterized protein n=1 Tax=Pleurotus cornucopiae TaxID=5321 RepID=A0ACB7IV32_PLECO|nr:hypothetical protein CCMSSC00406_0009563 [Pleurotus cornucopiae]
MPPGFFAKLVKASSPAGHQRERSSGDQGRRKSPSPSPSRRRLNSSATDASFSNTPSTFSTASASVLTSDSGSTNPNVTIVPPSPHASDVSSLPKANASKHSLNQFQTAETPDAKNSTYDDLPTPTLNRPSISEQTTITSAAKSLKGSSSSHSLRKLFSSQPPEPVPDLPLPEMRRQKSDRSLTQLPPPIQTNHQRATTTPAEAAESNATNDENSVTNGGLVMSPIVESPKDFKLPDVDVTSALARSATAPPGVESVEPRIQKPVANKRAWGRSNSRKPTGLASAIAASGLAMANPGMSAPHYAQLTPPTLTLGATKTNSPPTSRKSSLPGSPPLTAHTRLSSADLSPRSAKTHRSRRSAGSNPNTTRRPSLSVNSEHNSDAYGDERADYSGLGEDSSDEDSDSEDGIDNLDIGEDDIPVTGFAVASNKRNADFHELFSSIPYGDYLIEDYGCALQREILIQGRLYISENHICFHANIFGWITDLSIPIYEITTLEKKMTAFVIPNAIQISTRQAKYTFSSFLSRDTTFDVIFNIWRLAKPEDTGSMLSAPSIEGVGVESTEGLVTASSGPAKALAQKVTQCLCGKEGTHYSELALETIIPGTPDRIHNLMFASGFIKDFMRVDQKLIDVQISDWTPITPGSTLLARNMSYIKPLNGTVGPRQTKCEIRDETTYCDFEDYVTMLTTTRTPDVPSGGVFSVKTKTCIMWASAVSTKVVVTTQVEWTGRSFIKGIIERSAIEGQKVYHSDLDRAMRAYIQEHQSEFLPAGIDVAAITPQPEAVTSPTTASSPPLSTEEARKTREHERNQRAFQWAYDTFDGAFGVAKRSTFGALELIKDAWEQSSSTTILIFIIVGLVLSNLWTLTMMGKKEDEGRVKEAKRTLEREKWVQGVVTALWEELAAGKGPVGVVAPRDPLPAQTLPPLVMPQAGAGATSYGEEIKTIERALDAVEERLQMLRHSLQTVKSLHEVD